MLHSWRCGLLTARRSGPARAHATAIGPLLCDRNFRGYQMIIVLINAVVVSQLGERCRSNDLLI